MGTLLRFARRHEFAILICAWILIIIIIIIMALASSARAQAAPSPDRELVRQHRCVPLHAHLQPPVAGFLIVDTAAPERGLFWWPSDNLTSGMFVGWGGTWRLVDQCRR
jgi:hypothetical protein